MKKWFIALWLILMIFIGIYYLPNIGTDRRVLVGLNMTMFTVTFPSSVIFVFFMILVIKLFGNNLPHGQLVDFLLWLTFVAVGYVQWFVLVPKAIDRMKNERSVLIWGIVVVAIVVGLYGLYRFLYPPLS